MFQPFSSVNLICSNTRKWPTFWTQVVNGWDLLKHWRETHLLDASSAMVLICSKHIGKTHKLDTWSAIFISIFWSPQTLERNSLAGCAFSHSHQWFWSAQILDKRLTFWMCVQSFLSIVLISSSNSHPGHMFSHSHQCFQYAQTQWMATHILHLYPIYFISKIHVPLATVLPSCPFKKISGFNKLCQGTPHTYCHHLISLIFAVIQDVALTVWNTYQSQPAQVKDYN